jgi:TonB family protein
MRDSKRLKPRLSVLLAVGLPLLACLAPHAPVRSQEASRSRVVNSHAPVYPPVGVAIRAMGRVIVEVKIGDDGKVTGAKAKSGHPVLSRASEEAAARWTFEPARQGEQERTALLTFDFILEPTCKAEPIFRSPYEVEVRRTFDSYNASDTEDERPTDARNKHCPVHHLPLQEDKVGIVYGLMGYRPGFLEAEKKLFPYAITNVEGGCVVNMAKNPCTGEEVQVSPRFARVLYCPRCRAAQKRWSDAHPRQRG